MGHSLRTHRRPSHSGHTSGCIPWRGTRARRGAASPALPKRRNPPREWSLGCGRTRLVWRQLRTLLLLVRRQLELGLFGSRLSAVGGRRLGRASCNRRRLPGRRHGRSAAYRRGGRGGGGGGERGPTPHGDAQKNGQSENRGK